MRRSVMRGRPFGSASWAQRTAASLAAWDTPSVPAADRGRTQRKSSLPPLTAPRRGDVYFRSDIFRPSMNRSICPAGLYVFFSYWTLP